MRYLNKVNVWQSHGCLSVPWLSLCSCVCSVAYWTPYKLLLRIAPVRHSVYTNLNAQCDIRGVIRFASEMNEHKDQRRWRHNGRKRSVVLLLAQGQWLNAPKILDLMFVSYHNTTPRHNPQDFDLDPLNRLGYFFFFLSVWFFPLFPFAFIVHNFSHLVRM
jgi:hypothetical protein